MLTKRKNKEAKKKEKLYYYDIASHQGLPMISSVGPIYTTMWVHFPRPLPVHTFASRGNKRYRYYTCTNAIKNGRRKCPTASLSAGEIEKVVLDQIRCIGQDSALLRETLRQARLQAEEAMRRLTDERKIIERGLKP